MLLYACSTVYNGIGIILGVSECNIEVTYIADTAEFFNQSVPDFDGFVDAFLAQSGSDSVGVSDEGIFVVLDDIIVSL